MVKRELIVAILIAAIMVVASVGFFEVGFDMGKTQGNDNGFLKGSQSIILQTDDMIELQPNQSFYAESVPFGPGSVTVYFSFVLITEVPHNATAEMGILSNYTLPVFVPGPMVFNTGYCSYASGHISINLTNINYTPLEVIFKANSNNTSVVILEITSPLIAIVQ